jgi:hypothetical protein
MHVNFNNKDLPVVYYLLPDKKESTYVKAFKMLDARLKTKPTSLNVDFELAVFNAAKKVWPECHLYGCYFHLSQSIYKYIKKNKLVKEYSASEAFRKNYRQLQALAYLPEEDVIDGFNILKNNCIESFKSVLDYFFNTYIGDLKQNSNSIRNARFPIATWNVHIRCKLGLPRTNNKVECWHMLINNKATKNLTVYKLIELLRTEQSKVETDLVKLTMGELIKKKLKQDKKDKNLQTLCQNYEKTTNEKLLEYLDYISLNFELKLNFEFKLKYLFII